MFILCYLFLLMKENIVDKLQMMVRLIDNEACATVLYIDF